jgi:hypothetical protein
MNSFMAELLFKAIIRDSWAYAERKKLRACADVAMLPREVAEEGGSR